MRQSSSLSIGTKCMNLKVILTASHKNQIWISVLFPKCGITRAQNQRTGTT